MIRSTGLGFVVAAIFLVIGVPAALAQNVDEKLRSMSLEELIDVLRDNADISGNVTLGLAAREVLGRRGREDPDPVITILVKQLSSPPTKDRKATAARIAMIGVLQDMGAAAEGAVETLRSITNDSRESNDWVKTQARMALDRIGTPKAKKAVAESQNTELMRWAQAASPDEKRRAVAQNAYFIRRQLRSTEPNMQIVVAALDVLEVVGAHAVQAEPTLRRLAGEQRITSALRDRAVALTGDDAQNNGGKTEERDLVAELAAEISSGDSLVASLAMEEVARLGPSDETMFLLIDALENGIEPATAARLLGDYGARAEAAVPALLEQMSDDNAQPNILQALGKIGLADDRIANAIIRILNDRESPRRGLAASTAGTLKLSSTVPALLDALNDNRKFTRILAAKALGGFGEDSRVVPAIARLLDDADADVRLSGVDALAAMGPLSRPAVPHIAVRLQDEVSKVQIAATRALEKVGGPDATVILSKQAEAHAAADRARYKALRRQDEPVALQQFVRGLTLQRQVTVAREMVDDQDALIAYLGAGLLIRAGQETEAVPVLLRIIAVGGNDTDGPLRGRMGYDWVHAEDPELAQRMISGMVAHAKTVVDDLPADQQRRLRAFLDTYDR